MVRKAAVLFLVLIVCGASQIALADEPTASHPHVAVISLDGVPHDVDVLTVQAESGLVSLDVQDAQLDTGKLLVEESWLDAQIAHPAVLERRFSEVTDGGAQHYSMHLSDLHGGEVIRFREFQPSHERQFTWGSPSSIQMLDRPMFVEVEYYPDESPEGALVLDFDDGNTTGQDLAFSLDWLSLNGLKTPLFQTEDGDVIPTSAANGIYTVSAPHFSKIRVTNNGISLIVDQRPIEVYTDEDAGVLFHTENGTDVLHYEVHWGTDSNLLTNVAVGDNATLHRYMDVPGTDVYNTSRLASIPARSQPGVVYYRVHAVVDVTDILTDVLSFSVVQQNAPPYDPSPLYPLDGATDVPRVMELNWTSSDPEQEALEYQLFLGTENPPNSASGWNSNRTFMANLSYGTTYYWTVAVKDGGGNLVFSDVWDFTTETLDDLTPWAGFTYVVDDATRVVNFNATNSYDPDGEALTYSWAFGDGNGGSGKTATHTYTQDGAYSVVLNVTDGGPVSNWAESGHCVGVVILCVPAEQHDGGQDGDAPGNSACSNSLTLEGGAGGTPGAYNSNALSNLVLDNYDCFKFNMDAGVESLYVQTEAPSGVEFVLCDPEYGDSCIPRATWTGTSGFFWVRGEEGAWRLRASMDPLSTQTYEYHFSLGTSRDYDGDDYRTARTDDYREHFYYSLPWNDRDADDDTIPDGYERYWSLGATTPSGNAESADIDGIKNKDEYYFDPCGATPEQYDLLIEWDYGGGYHSDDGSNSNVHDDYGRPISRFRQNFLAHAEEDGGFVNDAFVYVAHGGNDKCGGSTVTGSHPRYFTPADLLNLRNSYMRADHHNSWHHVTSTHHDDGNEALGVGQTQGNLVSLHYQTMFDVGWSQLNVEATLCQEIGHNFGLHHPTDNDQEGTPLDLTCMYTGRKTATGYAHHDKMYACHDFGTGDEWAYVFLYMADRFPTAETACPNPS